MWIVVLLIVFAPVGIFLMWKYTNWQRPLKIGVAIVAGVFFLAAATGSLSDSKGGSEADKVTPASTSTPTPSGATTPPPAATTTPPTSAPPESGTPPPAATTAPVEPPPPPAAPAQDEVNPPKADPPKADQPKADPPKADPPKVDPPKNDPPKADPPKNDPPPASGNIVHPGAFCSPVGAMGVTDKGTAMVCSVKAGDSRARWRAA
ncbi:hypothetical protein [Embleya sp. MST-111070]|uniref:hypothetical protein n=1 Tax=Embleya sp. MST-111070 TaxID=3398231 RepID=UPI003F73D68E